MTPANRVLPSVLADIVRRAPASPEKVAFAWRVAVGPAVARTTRVRLADDGVLVVTADDAPWAREMERSAPVILKRLVDLLGPAVVTRLEVHAAGGREGGVR